MQSDYNISETLQNSVLKANRALNASATFWFLIAFIGQWLFVYYITIHYGGSALQGDMEAYSKPTIAGHVKGDLTGNLVFGAHVLMAAIISLGGALQLIPQIRARFITFHRWNGRLFIITAIIMGVGGLYLTWIRGSTTSLVGAIAITINAVLMIFFSVLAWRDARARKITAHRRWALRAFMMVNGVWFFRVGFMAWIILNQGPLGSTEQLDGPFDMVWAFANYLIPLGVLELYFYSQKSSNSKGKYITCISIFLLTLVMAVGIFGAFMFMWKPFL